MDIIHAIILGIVEGLTEFLPISSTGHMILASSIMDLRQDSFLKSFEICIQLGSILAVISVFYKRLYKDKLLWAKLIVGFIPTGILGLTLYKYIKTLFDIQIVSVSLIVGGVVFIILEIYRARHKSEEKAPLKDVGDISFKSAMIIGLAQSLAMIPGVSRSGASIVAGLLLGFDRKSAAEFSFLLALPTMMAATGYDALKNHQVILQGDNLSLMLVGGAVAFVSAFLAIKAFLGFVSRFSYLPFGVYRIVIGVVILCCIYFGVIE